MSGERKKINMDDEVKKIRRRWSSSPAFQEALATIRQEEERTERLAARVGGRAALEIVVDGRLRMLHDIAVAAELTNCCSDASSQGSTTQTKQHNNREPPPEEIVERHHQTPLDTDTELPSCSTSYGCTTRTTQRKQHNNRKRVTRNKLKRNATQKPKELEDDAESTN